jgi:hypothetical protein
MTEHIRIGDLLDAGYDMTKLPELDELIEMTVFAAAAGIAGHQRQIAEAMREDLTTKGADALPADLFDCNEDRVQLAASLLAHYGRAVDLLTDDLLRARFISALPADRVERELADAVDYRRRDRALTTIENLVADGDVSTEDLETVAEAIRGVSQRD